MDVLKILEDLDELLRNKKIASLLKLDKNNEAMKHIETAFALFEVKLMIGMNFIKK